MVTVVSLMGDHIVYLIWEISSAGTRVIYPGVQVMHIAGCAYVSSLAPQRNKIRPGAGLRPLVNEAEPG